MRWTAGIGAVTAEALAENCGSTVRSARARLLAAERHALVRRRRPLAGRPALYTITRAGLAVSGMRGVEPCRVSAANAHHLIACAAIAAALERCYPDHRVLGERELRRDERECGTPLASARLGVGPDGSPLLHRPDLVLLESGPQPGRPVAVEVELTIKASGRLVEICRAWARCRCVAGVLYLAPPEVERAVARAIDRAHAAERVVVVPLDALPSCPGAREGADRGHAPTERTIPGAA
jgi:hypothetical protein